MHTNPQPGGSATPTAPPQAPPRVAIVEDDRKVREFYRQLIEQTSGIEAVTCYGSAEAALADLPATRPNVILLDIGLPGMSGIEAIREFKRIAPDADIIMLTVFNDGDHLFEALSSGAMGYLIKTCTPAQIVAALFEVRQGGSPMSGTIARKVAEYFHNRAKPSAAAQQLSARELEIVQLLAQGLLYKEIADRLALSVHTIRTHCRNVYKKLHVRTRTEAVSKVLR